MNKDRRQKIRNAMSELDKVSRMVYSASNEEQDAMDNMPENLQGSFRYSDMEEAVGNMESAIEHIDAALDCLSEAI